MDIIDEMILKTDIAQNAIERAAIQAKLDGIAEGKLEGKVEDVCKLWQRKFGEAALTPTITAALERANVTMLDRILEQMVDPRYDIAQAQADFVV